MHFSSNPYKVIFYEKVGCSGNTKQKQLLKTQGISFETQNILEYPWSFEKLQPFFQGLQKEAMINQFAPKIKNKEIDLSTLTKTELINLMIQEPILIKRPLLEVGEVKICGFDIDTINQLLGSNICEKISIDTCQGENQCNHAL